MDGSLMSDRLMDFFRALMEKSMTDQPSAMDRYIAAQDMLKRRGQTGITTIDPGKNWHGFDALVLDPRDVSSYRMNRSGRMEDI
jgi:hypothetical protein